LLGASFRPSLTTTPLRSATVHRYPVLCGLSPPVIKHAWHTRELAPKLIWRYLQNYPHSANAKQSASATAAQSS
jgi:hypothetical protein